MNTTGITLLLLLTGWISPAVAFIQTNSHGIIQKTKWASHDDSINEEPINEETRMEMVRSLQASFYQNSKDPRPQLDPTTGILQHLPLWRVQWTELPGRSNVLNVHEGTYTNMFETILNGPKPWYFGHLFLPHGSENIKSEQYCYQLKTWQNELKDVTRATQPTRSASVGTLMRIVDVRRLKDGRLILLVQALERFVIHEVLQTLPYSRAHVQILPDWEDLKHPRATEEEAIGQRARAVVQSMKYHDYEYEATPLPLAQSEYLDVTDIFGTAVRAVIPFVPMSEDDSTLDRLEEEPILRSPSFGMEISMESKLLDGNVLSDPPTLPNSEEHTHENESLERLEQLMWLALEDFCTSTCRAGYIPAKELLQLRPPGLVSNFPDTRRPSPNYPALRRQRRLSFASAAMLEGTKIGADLRHVWLETPSTRARLTAVLNIFETSNRMMMGEFQ